MGSTDLPTQLMEAELDYFGRHMFDFKSAGPGKPVTGMFVFAILVSTWLDRESICGRYRVAGFPWLICYYAGQHHFEWKPAEGIAESGQGSTV